jgi:hypothetical protein
MLMTRGVVNGQDIGWLAVDTGASCFAVDPAAIEKLNLPSIAMAKLNAPSGDVSANVRTCDTLTLGAAAAANLSCIGPCCDRADAATEPDLRLQPRGIVGGDVFAGNPFTIDFRDDS